MKTKENSKENNQTCHTDSVEKYKGPATISFIDKNPNRKTIEAHAATGSIRTNLKVRTHKFMADETAKHGGDLTQEQTDELMKVSVSPGHKMIRDGVQLFTCKA